MSAPVEKESATRIVAGDENSSANSTLEKSNNLSEKQDSLNESDIEGQPENNNKTIVQKAWGHKVIIIAYIVLFFTAYVESFAADSTRNLDAYATSSFNAHSLIATAAVIYKITAICAYPILAKIGDFLGRGEGFGLSVFIYTLAYVLYASCSNIQTYLVAEIFYAIGKNGYRVFQQIFIADTTSLINRGLLSQLPDAIAGIPSSYAGSSVQDAFLDHSTWRWGYGCFAIILGVSVIPLTMMMFYLDKRAKKYGYRKEIKIMQNIPQGPWYKKAYYLLFVELDIIGGALLLTGFALFFLPFTLTGSKSAYRWHEPELKAMLIVGFVIFCFFLVWNFVLKSKPIPNRQPFVPPQSFSNSTVALILIMVALDLCKNSSISTYQATVFQVGGYLTAGQATRIDNSKKITYDIASIITGLGMKFTKRSKIFTLIGVPLQVLGHGLYTYFFNRNGEFESNVILFYVANIMTGFGRGMYQAALQVTIQAIAGVDGIAMSTAFFMAFNSVGSLIGSAIAGGIWNSVVLEKLRKYLPADSKDQATKIYKSIKVAKSFKKKTPERIAISKAYRETIQIIGWTGLGICSVMLILMFFVQEVVLTEKSDAYGNTRDATSTVGEEHEEDEGQPRVSDKGHILVNEKRTWKNFWRV